MITKDELLLTHFELSQLPSEFIDGRWYYNPYEIMRKQLEKVNRWLEEQGAVVEIRNPNWPKNRQEDKFIYKPLKLEEK